MSRPGPLAPPFDAYHDEVVAALRMIGDPAWGAAIQRDRGSAMPHLGISFPDLRRRVAQGFSFSRLPPDDVLRAWDALWQGSPYGDVLFAAIEHCARVVRRPGSGAWPVVRHWTARVDNWCHADGLSGVYSRLLEQAHDDVYPQLEAWNRAEDQWLRRISLVSLIHYSGKHAVFLPPEAVLPLVSSCLADRRRHVELAVGWVLREMGNAYPNEITRYLEANATALSAQALSRAIERRPAEERARLRALRVPGSH